jgi:hypothetical protein
MAKRKAAAPSECQTALPLPDPPPASNGDGSPKRSPPVWKKRLFSNGSYVECAVFRTEVDRGQSSFSAYSVILDRSYKGVDGKWHTTHFLKRDDLLVGAHVLQRAYAWISEQEKH